jgi:hypothetical protein
MVMVFVFPLEGHASGRVMVTILVFHVMLFFGILSASEAAAGREVTTPAGPPAGAPP